MDPPGFQKIPPTSTTSPDPLPEGATTTGPATASPRDEDDFFDDDPAGPASPPPGSATTTGSSRASIDPASVKLLAEVTHALVYSASLLVRLVRKRRRPGLSEGIWVANEEERAAMGDPLARIAARHSPLEGDDTGDVIDGMLVIAGATGYALNHASAEGAHGPIADLTIPDDAG